jgi:hypothetical protein
MGSTNSHNLFYKRHNIFPKSRFPVISAGFLGHRLSVLCAFASFASAWANAPFINITIEIKTSLVVAYSTALILDLLKTF